MSKAAFRHASGARLKMGNHGVPGLAAAPGSLMG
jgi:hypothetical protein